MDTNSQPNLVLGIDTGGTYIDSVLLEYEMRRVLAAHKSLTTKRDFSIGIENVIEGIHIDDPSAIRMVSISTTLATNAIAEGKGKRVALLLIGYDPPRYGLYVAGVNAPDLEQLSELRLSLEGLSARLAAQRATGDDLVILEALRQEQASTPPEDSKRLFDVDHKFHQAVAQAAHNKYLADSLERLFGLSQQLWYLALPKLGFLPGSVEKHLDLVHAIKTGNGDEAEQIMRAHVAEFYAQVRQVLQNP